MNFDSIEYLKTGTLRQQQAYRAMGHVRVLEILKNFAPVLAGTIPINVDIETSDLDIICCWKDKTTFINTIYNNFSGLKDFAYHDFILRGHETVTANFWSDEFAFEIFGQPRPVKQQESYRHMMIEYYVLQQNDERFREKIIELKKHGLKTETAFAKLLNLPGQDPYTELLTYGAQHFPL